MSAVMSYFDSPPLSFSKKHLCCFPNVLIEPSSIMATDSRMETFVDVELQDMHNESDRNQSPELTYRGGTGKTHGHYNGLHLDPEVQSTHQRLHEAVQPIIFIISRFKNVVLMVPAFFIFNLIGFVSYSTLFIALPFRFNECIKSNNIPFAVITIMLGAFFGMTSILTLLHFVRCVFTSSSVSDNPPSISSSALSNVTMKTCPKCSNIKPSRSHHCSICGSCTLKMDHHCPWVANCVGYFNYKYFCCFIWLATISCHLSSFMAFDQIFTILNVWANV